jgi:hypothetical protein
MIFLFNVPAIISAVHPAFLPVDARVSLTGGYRDRTSVEFGNPSPTSQRSLSVFIRDCSPSYRPERSATE